MSGRIVVSKKLLVINSASSIATRLISVVVLIWVQQYLLKRISVEEYSLLPIVYSIMIFVPIFTMILSSGIRRYVVEAYANNAGEQISKIVSTMFPILFMGSISLLALGGILAWKIDVVLRIAPEYVDDARIMLMLIISLEALRLSLQAFSSGLYVKQRFVLENVIKIGSECIRLALLFSLLLGFSVSVVSVVISTVVAGLLEVTILYVVSRKMLPDQRFDISKFEWSIMKDLTRFGGWSSLYGIAGMVRKASDPIILNRLSSPLEVTYFHLGSLVPNRMEVIVNQSFLGSVSPVVVGLHADGQDEKLKKLYLRLGRIAMWGVLLVIAPFLVHYEQIVTLYVGSNFLPAGTVMILLLACYPIVYGNILHTSLAHAKIRMKSLALRESASALINLILTLILVGKFQMGAIGAATSTFIVYGLGSIVIFWPFGKGMVNATWQEIWSDVFLPGIMPLFSAVLVMSVLAAQFPTDSLMSIGFNVLLGSLAYLLILWFCAKDNDKMQLKAAIQSMLQRKSVS